MNNNPDQPVAPYYVKGLALGLSAFLIGIHLWTWVFTLPVFLHGRADFRQLYTAGYLVRSGRGHQLYDYDTQFRFQNELVSKAEIALPFIRPAYQALLFVPFSFLTYRSRVLRISGGKPGSALGLVPSATAENEPDRSRLSLAARRHVSGFSSNSRGTHPRSGFHIAGDPTGGGAGCTQSHARIDGRNPAWVGIVQVSDRHSYRVTVPGVEALAFFSGFALSSFCLGAISVWLVGLSQAGIYVRSLIAMGSGSAGRADQLRYPISMNVMPNLHGLIFGLAGSRVSAFSIAAVTVILSSVVGVAVAARPPANRSGEDSLRLAISAATVVSYYLFIHDLSILIIPIAITLDRFIDAEATGDKLAAGWHAHRPCYLSPQFACHTFRNISM